jgi:hypothetical protein
VKPGGGGDSGTTPDAPATVPEGSATTPRVRDRDVVVVAAAVVAAVLGIDLASAAIPALDHLLSAAPVLVIVLVVGTVVVLYRALRRPAAR